MYIITCPNNNPNWYFCAFLCGSKHLEWDLFQRYLADSTTQVWLLGRMKEIVWKLKFTFVTVSHRHMGGSIFLTKEFWLHVYFKLFNLVISLICSELRWWIGDNACKISSATSIFFFFTNIFIIDERTRSTKIKR